MNQTATAMRAAFDAAVRKATTSAVQADIKSALRRKVGLTTRKTMWSVQRGKR